MEKVTSAEVECLTDGLAL